MLTDKYFWFAQPSSILNNYDWVAGYIFLGLIVASLVLWLTRMILIKHPIARKLLSRLMRMSYSMGIVGLLWFGFRYQNIPIFSKRIWAGIIILVILIWLFWIIKYAMFQFKLEKREHDDYLLRSKYLPNKK